MKIEIWEWNQKGAKCWNGSQMWKTKNENENENENFFVVVVVVVVGEIKEIRWIQKKVAKMKRKPKKKKKKLDDKQWMNVFAFEKISSLYTITNNSVDIAATVLSSSFHFECFEKLSNSIGEQNFLWNKKKWRSKKIFSFSFFVKETCHMNKESDVH